jgi:hypothetical protein
MAERFSFAERPDGAGVSKQLTNRGRSEGFLDRSDRIVQLAVQGAQGHTMRPDTKRAMLDSPQRIYRCDHLQHTDVVRLTCQDEPSPTASLRRN